MVESDDIPVAEAVGGFGPNRTFKGDGSKKTRPGNSCLNTTWASSRPSSTESRLIIDFYAGSKVSPCGPDNAPLFDDDILNAVPEAVEQRGVSNEEWIQWIEKFTKTTQATRTSVGCLVMLWIPLITAPFAIMRQNKLQRALAKMSSDFNREVLEPKGMYAKIQTVVFQADKYREQLSWISIALDAEEVQSLQEEVHFFGYNPFTGNMKAMDSCATCSCCTSCCGVKQMV